MEKLDVMEKLDENPNNLELKQKMNYLKKWEAVIKERKEDLNKLH